MVYQQNYHKIFNSFYDEGSIKQNQLILTDEDNAEYEPIINAIKTTEA